MRQDLALAPPLRPRPSGMRAFFDRITLSHDDEDGTPDSQLSARAAYNPANDTRDLDQRVREIGEW